MANFKMKQERQELIEEQYKLLEKNGYDVIKKCKEDISQIQYKLSQAKPENFDSIIEYKNWNTYAKKRKYLLVNVLTYAKRIQKI